jgi:hypothetical protein
MNIHILPTYKASRLQKTKYGNLFLVNKFKSYDNCTPQHIYITNDEEIKPNDWYENNGVIFKADTLFDEGNNPNNSNPRVTDFNKKIILTTDPQLIEDGVQEIDKTFLEWFVKNPSCEFVDIERGFLTLTGWVKSKDTAPKNLIRYKIIIPQEPKQETLEQSYQRGYERGLNALIPLIENLNKEITELKRNLYIR